MSRLSLAGPVPLRGRIRVPGDKSISHRVLLMAALAEGESVLRGVSTGDDVQRTRAAIHDLGATVTEDGDALRVAGGHLHEPSGDLDLGNSGTGMRLLAGVCAGRPWTVRLDGDASLQRRPMDRIAVPLRAMGATVNGQGSECTPPLVITGGGLEGIEYDLPVPSAQVKGAVLLAGLGASGETIVRETVPTRVHTEELLASFGAEVTVGPGEVRVRPSQLRPVELAVPGDPSQAAFWLVAGAVVPGSDVTVEDVYLGPARAGFLDVLVRMGADLEIDRERGHVRVRSGPLHGTDVDPPEIPGLVDEIPVLAVAAALAEGTTVFHGVEELRVKESDRLATIQSELGVLGARVEAAGDDLVVHGGHLRAGDVSSHGDHRIAMAAAVAALSADGPTTIDDWSVVATSYPTFEQDLERLTAV